MNFQHGIFCFDAINFSDSPLCQVQRNEKYKETNIYLLLFSFHDSIEVIYKGRS
jgi:hypothetical protein